MNFRFIALIIPGLLLNSCSSSYDSRFPMEKRFWTPEDYDEVTLQIQYYTPEGQRFPEISNPETEHIFRKMIDRQNFLVVLEDDQLGVKHKNAVAGKFFDEYRDMVKIYYQTDRQDKFVYGMELIELLKFGLELQLHYFRLGNEEILMEADDPKASRIRSIINSNEDTAFGNFNNYLDLVNNESAFDESELNSFVIGIDSYFPRLFETFPNGNLNITKKKTDLMLKKVKSPSVQNSLQNLLSLIERLLVEKSNDIN